MGSTGFFWLDGLFPNSKALINEERDHVVTLLNDYCYDITGKVESKGYRELSTEDLSLVESWSFSRTRLLSMGECSYCEEPLIV
jgi:hypothetical protein